MSPTSAHYRVLMLDTWLLYKMTQNATVYLQGWSGQPRYKHLGLCKFFTSIHASLTLYSNINLNTEERTKGTRAWLTSKSRRSTCAVCIRRNQCHTCGFKVLLCNRSSSHKDTPPAVCPGRDRLASRLRTLTMKQLRSWLYALHCFTNIF